MTSYDKIIHTPRLPSVRHAVTKQAVYSNQVVLFGFAMSRSRSRCPCVLPAPCVSVNKARPRAAGNKTACCGQGALRILGVFVRRSDKSTTRRAFDPTANNFHSNSRRISFTVALFLRILRRKNKHEKKKKKKKFVWRFYRLHIITPREEKQVFFVRRVIAIV